MSTTPALAHCWRRHMTRHPSLCAHHIVCTPRAAACEAPVAAHAQCHLPFSCHPCSRELLNVLQAVPNRAEYCNEERLSPVCEQLLAACIQRSSPQLPQHLRFPAAGGATRQIWICWLATQAAYHIPLHVTNLQLRSRHAIAFLVSPLQPTTSECASSLTKARREQ